MFEVVIFRCSKLILLDVLVRLSWNCVNMIVYVV